MTAQPHTFPGARGDTLVEGVTYYDLYEAVQVGLCRAAGMPDDTNVFDLDLGDIDPIAAAKNVCVNVEERQGIYPNIPGGTTE